jgi:hypothetical protein
MVRILILLRRWYGIYIYGHMIINVMVIDSAYIAFIVHHKRTLSLSYYYHYPNDHSKSTPIVHPLHHTHHLCLHRPISIAIVSLSTTQVIGLSLKSFLYISLCCIMSHSLHLKHLLPSPFFVYVSHQYQTCLYVSREGTKVGMHTKCNNKIKHVKASLEC